MRKAAIHKFEHDVPRVEHPRTTSSSVPLARARWDDLKLFLDVANAGSFRAAAQSRRLAVNTVRRCIERLENDLGVKLFRRSRAGLDLTPEGALLKPKALRMRSSAAAGHTEEHGHRLVQPGEIRLGASEALGSGWLTPRLLELQSQFPELTVTLLCDYDVATERPELDVVSYGAVPRIRMSFRPVWQTIHFMPFASRAYLEKYGTPMTMDDLLNHRYIEQVAPGVKSSLLDQMVGTTRPPGFLPLRTNSSLALFWAVATGAGIAWMPTYAMAVTRQLVPIDLPFVLKFDIFYYFHPDAGNSQPVRSTITWLKEIFDPVRYPFFRREFVHPRDFRGDTTTFDGTVVQLFEPLIGEPPSPPDLQ